MAVRTLAMRSSAFEDGGTIPLRFTCDGEEQSPPLAWDRAPEGTTSLALMVHDPDAARGDFTHWVLFNLPPGTTEIAAGVGSGGELPGGARQGRNDFGKLGYGGPCPPAGPAHGYVFGLTALDAALDLPEGATREQVEWAMAGHVRAQAQLTARYARQH